MKTSPVFRIFFLTLFAGASLYGSALQYEVTDLGTLGGSLSQAYGVNNAGQVTGYSYTTNDAAQHAFLYSNGSMSDLGGLGGSYSQGYGINLAGQATGYSAIAGDAAQHAFVYQNGVMTDIGTLGGTNSQGFALNANGQSVGQADDASKNGRAFLYSNGSMADLGTLGGTFSYATSINQSGQVAGTSNLTGDSTAHAFIYQNGVMSDLGTLGGDRSEGNGINESGQVTGLSYTANNAASHAFIYSNGAMSDLGTLGGNYSSGFSINKSGQVTGYSQISNNFDTHPFIYSGGTMHDLYTIVTGVSNISLSDVGTSVNDWGQVVATATVSGGQTHAVLLSPITPYVTNTGASITARVVYGVDYSAIGGTNSTAGLGTGVQLGGVAGSNQNVVQTFSSIIPGLASDVLHLSGTAPDTIVLRMTYDKATAVALFGSEDQAYLGWLDPNDNTWKNSVLGNAGISTPTFVSGAYDPNTDFILGYYGVDTTNSEVWAVINHNSTFGVMGNIPVPVPEPSSALLAAFTGAVALMSRRRKTVRR